MASGRPDSPWTSAVPFAVIALLIEITTALPPGPAHLTSFLAGSAILVVVVGTMLLPWNLFPDWIKLLQSISFVLAVAVLVDSVGGHDSGLLPVFIAPILWTALYQNRWQSAVVVAVVVLAVGEVAVLEGDPAYLVLRRLVFWGTMGALIAIATLALRGRLSRAVSEREELLRQAKALRQAAERLNQLLSSDAVLSEACRLTALMASPPGATARRAAYLILDGDAVINRWHFDEGVGPSDKRQLLADNPHLRDVLLSGRPAAGAYADQGMAPNALAEMQRDGLTHGAWIRVAPHGAVHGVLAMSSRGYPISADIFERAIAMGHILELALANALTLERSEKDAATDSLTGLANRRGFDHGAERLRGRLPFAVLALDIDGLKAVNDLSGHAAGDALLQLVGRTAAGVMRSGDLMARVGGDEFAGFLSDCSEPGARMAARRILEALTATSAAGVVPHVSIGVACGGSGSNLAEVLDMADAAMYRAKHQGGGSYVVGDVSALDRPAVRGAVVAV